MKKYIVPLAIIAAIGGLLAYVLYLSVTGSYSPRDIPSPLIGKPLPSFSLPTVANPARKISDKDLRGRVYLLNVWASWCPACLQEHPVLNEIARRKTVPIIGLNYKDKREDALRWLTELGNPYQQSLADSDGRLGIDLGVYGAPETFILDKNGVIRYKHIGPITAEIWQEKLLPFVQQLEK